jgi:hypothetical protein
VQVHRPKGGLHPASGASTARVGSPVATLRKGGSSLVRAAVPTPHSLSSIRLRGALAAICTTSVVAIATLSPVPAPAATRASTTVPKTTTTTTVVSPAPVPITPETPGWTTVATTSRGVAIDERTVVQPDGARITLARFLSGNVTFSLHVGSSNPPVANVPPGAGSSVGPGEAPRLLACFNGGFMIAESGGGFEVAGQTFYGLNNGAASFVIDNFGAATIGAWNSLQVPYVGESVYSVRQNLSPLISGGVASPSINSVAAWGATLGGIPNPARSAAGMDAQGNIIYAGSEAALPSDMAAALIGVGVIQGMQLDINPAWIMLGLANTPGGPLSPGVPGQSPGASACQSGWSRDFIAVLAVP